MERGRGSCYCWNGIVDKYSGARVWISCGPQLFNFRCVCKTMVTNDCLDLVDRAGCRILQVRNPWSSPGVPKPSFSMTELRESLLEESIDDDPAVGTFW